MSNKLTKADFRTPNGKNWEIVLTDNNSDHLTLSNLSGPQANALRNILESAKHVSWKTPTSGLEINIEYVN